MRRFILYCGWVVENHPLQVYASALVFSPARSITRDLFKQEVRRWITTEPVVEDDWNVCLHTMEHGEAVNSVAFLPDSKLVASGSSDKTVKIWDAGMGTCTQTLQGHGEEYSGSMPASSRSSPVTSPAMKRPGAYRGRRLSIDGRICYQRNL